MNGDTPVQPGSVQPKAPWQYKPESTPAAPPPPVETAEPDTYELPQAPEATWTASEFIDHTKGMTWYLILGGATFVLVVLLYFFTHDFVSIIGVVAMAVLFGIVASRKPRVMNYHLDGSGLSIGEVFHPYAEFKSFAIMDDGAFSSITLLPLKRLMPPISVYFSAEDQDSIVAVISQYLPMETRERDAIDRLSRRIRF